MDEVCNGDNQAIIIILFDFRFSVSAVNDWSKAFNGGIIENVSSVVAEKEKNRFTSSLHWINGD